MNNSTNLLIQTDANPSIGSGHVMRCLALAQTAKDYGIQTFFVMNTCSKIIKKRIESQGFELRPRMSEEKHVIIDGYQFDTHVQQTMKAQGRRVLFIDDFGHCDRYVSDLVLNQNIYADQSFYPDHSDETTFLLGPRYVLLRREFLQKKPAPKQHEKRNVLISVGGFDQQDMLNRLEKTFKKMGYDVRAAKNTIDMPALMQWADIAVTAAGTTAYELAYMNVPMIMIVMADNQQRVAEGMADAGYGINLGWHENVTDKMIHAAMKKSIFSPRKSIIDGYGADRVLSNLFKWPIWLRPIIKEDCELLFRWANDPVIRAMSLSPETIAWDRHQAWFNKKMNDRSCRIFIAIDTVKDHPIGQIRFDCENEKAEVDVHIDPKMRGLGMGTRLIILGTKRILATAIIKTINAKIKKGNNASIEAFEKAGFLRNDESRLYYSLI